MVSGRRVKRNCQIQRSESLTAKFMSNKTPTKILGEMEVQIFGEIHSEYFIEFSSFKIPHGLLVKTVSLRDNYSCNTGQK